MTETTQQVQKTAIQFSAGDDLKTFAQKLQRLVVDIQAVESAVNALIAAQGTSSSGSEPPWELATTSGLGPDFTVEGLTAGMVLRAISDSNAAFQQLKFGDLAKSDVSDNPENGQVMQFVDGYWTAVDAAAVDGVTGAQDVGAGSAGVYGGLDGTILNLKTLVQGSGIALTQDSETVTITALGGGTAGRAGKQGPPGKDGANGKPGPPGTRGKNGVAGATGATGAQQPPGAAWISTVHGGVIVLPVNAVPRFITGPYTIKNVVILTEGGPGSCVVDVWKLNIGTGYPPTSANDITGANPPTITGGTTYQNSTLTGWTTALVTGDVLLFSLASSSNFSYISIQVQIG